MTNPDRDCSMLSQSESESMNGIDQEVTRGNILENNLVGTENL